MKSKIFIFVMLVFITGCSDIPTPKKGANSDNSSPAKSNVDESKITGNRITSALATYRADHLEFPARLDLLVPKYIPKIDPPVAGSRTWIYNTEEDAQRYKLSFKTSSSECCFDSKDNHWICD
jgi:hypothetical protein